ncbi:GNAT family N-acetyltransferase [Candidatus Woesebacteria bacterium]|nr:GNAT family N-acetyltransferase [Candidatus Woesebacteria bacterium]
MKVELTNGNITLRPFTLADAEYHLTHEDQEIEKWLSGGKSTLESVTTWIQRNADSWAVGGPVFNFAIVDTSGTLVGMVEARPIDPAAFTTQEGDVNISYGIYPEARGKNYAVEAVELIMQFLKTHDHNRAVIRVNPEKIASLSVPRKLGFVELEDASKDELIAFGKLL